MIYYTNNFPERNYILDVTLKKLCKDTKKINRLKRANLSKDQLRNLLERNIISMKEYLLIIGS
jgi:ribosomal protein L19E